MSEILLVVQPFSTLAMVGLIWFVQVVQDPLFAQVGNAGFHQYEVSHQRRTTVVVAPLMLVEAFSAVVLLWIRPIGVSDAMVWFGLGLLLAIWASTYLLQVNASSCTRKVIEALRLAHASSAGPFQLGANC